MSQKAVIYCRVSSIKQSTEGHGLESQESRCRDFAKAKGYNIVAVFTDDVSGGGDFMKRPGMVKLLQYLDDHISEPHVVIFDDLKRYARDTIFHLQLRNEMTLRNARRECLNFKFEDTPEGEFIETIIAAQGQLERQQNSRQVTQKMQARVKAGYWVFHAPPGYRYKTVSGHGKMLILDEPCASVVREGMEGFASGRFSKQTDVQRFFKDSPHFPKDKKGHVHLSRIKEMFTRPLYAGLLDKPEWGISMQKGKHEALISVETYMKIQERLSGKAKAPFKSNLHEDFPMRGFVRCGCCGHPMTSCWAQGRKEKYPYYMCFNKECPQRSRSIRREKIEAAFEELLDSITPCAEIVATARAIFTDLWEEKQASASQDTDALRLSLAQADKQSGQILTRILETDSPILITAYEKKIKELEGEKLVLQEKIARCGTPLASFDETFEVFQRVCVPSHAGRDGLPRKPKETLGFREI